jgi:RimJ/RimL family protein N-acetyltransferase
MMLTDKPLIGGVVALEPMTEAHAGDLLAAAETPATFRYFTRPPVTWDVAGMTGYCAGLIANPTIQPFVVREREAGTIVGSTTYCDIRPDHRGLEIGWTWYAPSARGTTVNPACKLLLLEHAFETPLFAGHAAIRVQLKTDARNTRSRAAIEKLGAAFEGILRDHIVMPDGHFRSTALYSITAGEWPGVQKTLRARVG